MGSGKNITIYFSDEDYLVYLKHKQEINEAARKAVKDKIKILSGKK